MDVDVAQRFGWAPGELARAFLDGGARCLQIRAKTLPSGPLLELCDRVVELAASCDAEVIVNDRADVALVSGAAGVHLGQEDLPPVAARALLGDAAIIGYSTHSLSQVGEALAEPVNYVAIGPIFGTQTKQTGYEAVGLDLLRAAVTRARPRPVVAIGGITLDRAASVWDAGATSVAVITDLFATGDPAERVRAYLRAAPSGTRI